MGEKGTSELCPRRRGKFEVQGDCRAYFSTRAPARKPRTEVRPTISGEPIIAPWTLL
jgi:hypothetical protein